MANFRMSFTCWKSTPAPSRTVPFDSKATGKQLAKIAARCMVGQSLEQQGIEKEVIPPYFSVKEAVFPFVKFPGVDTILGPEMKSTGEVMGVGKSFGEAFVKSQMAAGVNLPRTGKVFFVGQGQRQTESGQGCQGSGPDGLYHHGNERHSQSHA